MIMLRTLVILGLCISAIGLIFGGTAEGSYLGVKWHSGKHLIIYDTTSHPQWTDALNAAAQDWNQSPYVKFTVVKADDCGHTHAVTVCEFDSPYPPYYAFARIYVRNGQWIANVEIMLNDHEVDWTRDSTVYQRTLCHELGHALGLDYDPNAADSCMGNGGAHPGVHDYEELGLLYAK